MNDPRAPRLIGVQRHALRDPVDRLDRRVPPFDRPGFVSFGDSRSLLERRGVEWTDELRNDLLTMSMCLAFGGRFHDKAAEDRVRTTVIFEAGPIDPSHNVPVDLTNRPELPKARDLKAMILHETETGLVLDPEHLVGGAGLYHVATADTCAQLLAQWPALLTLIGEWMDVLYAAGSEQAEGAEQS